MVQSRLRNREKAFSSSFFLFVGVGRMGHSSAVWDQRAAVQVEKDWNGIDQVTLRVPRGASARV